MVDSASGKRPVAAVYIPFKTLLTSTDVLAQGLPRRIDGSAFPTFAGGMRSWVLSAYQFLDFIEKDGTVKPALEQWIRSDPEERAVMMRKLLSEKYPEVVKLAGEHGTPAQMRAEIEKLGVSGSTAHRAVKFFLDAAAFAGIVVPPSWKKIAVTPGSTSSRRKKRPSGVSASRADVDVDDDDDQVPPPFNYPPVFNQALIRGLIEAMPEPGREWSNADQEQWFTLAKSIFRIVYKQPMAQLSAPAAPPRAME